MCSEFVTPQKNMLTTQPNLKKKKKKKRQVNKIMKILKK